jgi:hypothetical protein
MGVLVGVKIEGLGVDDGEIVAGGDGLGAEMLMNGAGDTGEGFTGVVIDDDSATGLQPREHEPERIADAFVEIAVKEGESYFVWDVSCRQVFEPAFVDYGRVQVGSVELAEKELFAHGQLTRGEGLPCCGRVPSGLGRQPLETIIDMKRAGRAMRIKEASDKKACGTGIATKLYDCSFGAVNTDFL